MKEFYVDTGIPETLKVIYQDDDKEISNQINWKGQRLHISSPVRLFSPDKRFIVVNQVVGQYDTYLGRIGYETVGTVARLEPPVAIRILSYLFLAQPYGNYCINDVEEFEIFQNLFSLHLRIKEDEENES